MSRSWCKRLNATRSAIPASALDEEYQDDDDDEPSGESRDDERSGTRYNVSSRSLFPCSLERRHSNYFLFPHLSFCAVYMVPRHLRNWCDVCRDAPHRLVRPRVSLPIPLSLLIKLHVTTGTSSSRIRTRTTNRTCTSADPRSRCGCGSCRAGCACCSTCGACSHR